MNDGKSFGKKSKKVFHDKFQMQMMFHQNVFYMQLIEENSERQLETLSKHQTETPKGDSNIQILVTSVV